MYFKRLELVGFKSFCDKTVLHFEPGITAVVGPNGCGKSNIFDSIRWVLGEQSVKALRGSDMQDVIFNGTDTKEPLSMAEVTLAFDNTNKVFNVNNNEVAITRRIFRSGESEYLLNKSQVRLKDILDLLLGTGIGAESYSLVQQGKIDLVLSSKPEDRRLVFDEASGITKYKAQKREALRKLDETEQNLLRVNDIIIEVKRQIGSLERQANKARRYKEVFDELKSKEINFALIQKALLLGEREKIAYSLKELEAKEAGLLGAIREEENKAFSRQDELKNVEENINSIKNEISGLENLTSKNRQHIIFDKERIQELKSNTDYLNSQREQTKLKIEQTQEKLNKLRFEYEGLNKNIEDRNQLLAAKEAELESISTAITRSLDTITDSKKKILELAARIANARNLLNDALSKQQIFLARKKRLEIEKLKVSDEKISCEAGLASINQEIGALEHNFTELNLKVTETKGELEKEGVSIKTIESDISDLEKKIVTLFSQKEFLGKLRTEYDGIGESMNAVIYLDKLPKEKMSGMVVKVNTGSEAFPENQAANQEGQGFKFSGEAKPIDLDTKKIEERIEETQHSIDSLQVIKRVKESRVDELNKDMVVSQEAVRAQEIALANKKAYRETIQEQFNKIKAEEEIVVIELTDVETELSTFAVSIKRHEDDSAALDKEKAAAEEAISSEQNNITASNKLKEGVLVVITQTKTELEALNKRLTTDLASLKALEEEDSHSKGTLLNLDNQINDCASRSVALDSEIAEMENQILESEKNKNNLAALLEETQSKFKGIIDESGAITQRIGSARKELDGLKEQLYELQMKNKDVDFKYLNIKERLSAAYKFDLDLPGELDKPCVEPVAGQTDMDALAQEIQKLKERLDSCGTVNLVAIEEYDELKKRYDFLTQQQSDLVSAKDSLHEAILKINRTTKKMFMETFEKVQVEFRTYFRLLFNGGDAQVFLIDENDPLESGIEIICRPPGKKLQNVLLLSGGEKSMAAIALIFAIFKVKPAPFCILDEIDAALDEANVDRFGRMLLEFAKISQFIVITHNKKTIANADVMYGITMQQSGVSKIVSVKFHQDREAAEKEREADADAVGEPA